MKRMCRQGKQYEEAFECGEYSLLAAIINQAIIDYKELPSKSKHYKCAKSFLKDLNII